MNKQEKIASILDDIKKEIKKISDQNLGQDTPDLVGNIIRKYVGNIDIDQYRSFIQFELDVNGDQITVRPTNLFTGLLLLGIIVEPDQLGNEYETENYTVSIENGKFNIRPKKPLDFVKLDFTIPKE